MRKRIIKAIKKTLALLNSIIPKNKHRILFKSVPDYTGNAKALSDYIYLNHERYELIWLYNTYINNNDKKIKWVKSRTLRSIYYLLTSRYIVTTHNEMISLAGKNQLYISLWHGMPFKKICYLTPKDADFMESYSAKRIATSEIMRAVIASAFHERADNVFITGQPRNDFLFERKEFDFIDYDRFSKIVLYAPTFRQNEYVHNNNDGKKIVYDNIFRLDDFEISKLCDFLESNKILLLVKLHPFEENALNGVDFPECIKIIKSNEFNSLGYDINHLLAISDCLLTDYSSTFFDYLILNRPIGFVIPDLEAYEKSRGGFTLEPASFWMPGEKISSQYELIKFLNMVIVNKEDLHRSSREQVNNALNTYKDSLNSKRVYELFISGGEK